MTRRLAALTLVALTLVPAASAKTITGTAKNDVLRGTAKADKIYGKQGQDFLYGNGGPDVLVPGTGRDVVYCGAAATFAIAVNGLFKGEKASGTVRFDMTFTREETEFSCTSGNVTWEALRLP